MLEKDGSPRQYDKFAYTEGFNIRPRPFECDIRLRIEERREVSLVEKGKEESVLNPSSPFKSEEHLPSKSQSGRQCLFI